MIKKSTLLLLLLAEATAAYAATPTSPEPIYVIVDKETGIPVKVSKDNNGIPVKFVEPPKTGIPVVIVDDKATNGILVRIVNSHDQ